MALPEIREVDLQYLNQWMSNLVDIINYDLNKIESAVPALSQVLTNTDPAPIQYLRDSLNELVNSLNSAFKQIDDRFRVLERTKSLGG